MHVAGTALSTSPPVEEDLDDVDHFTCCDPSYYLRTDRPIYALCGHTMRSDDEIRLDVIEDRLCRACLKIARSLWYPSQVCERHCPRLYFD